MTNPLLTPFELPPFSKILPEHVVPAVTKALNDCRENVERVVAQGAPYTWENLCQPLAEVDDVLGRIFSPVSHLNSVKNSPELREAYEQTLPLLSEYSTWVGQHEGLYKAYRDLRDGDHYATLNTAQKKAVDNALRDFELSGIGLPKEKQQRYGEIATRLSELGNQYSNNVLDATMGWTKLVTDEAELAGMPESALGKKEMRVFQSLVGPDLDADGLLEPARLLATKRVVVKRPDYAPPLANVATPNAVVTKGHRFDIYAGTPV